MVGQTTWLVVGLVIVLWLCYKKEAFEDFSWLGDDSVTPYTDTAPREPSYPRDSRASAQFTSDVTPPEAMIQSSPDLPFSTSPTDTPMIYTAAGSVATSTPLFTSATL